MVVLLNFNFRGVCNEAEGKKYSALVNIIKNVSICYLVQTAQQTHGALSRQKPKNGLLKCQQELRLKFSINDT